MSKAPWTWSLGLRSHNSDMPGEVDGCEGRSEKELRIPQPALGFWLCALATWTSQARSLGLQSHSGNKAQHHPTKGNKASVTPGNQRR